MRRKNLSVLTIIMAATLGMTGCGASGSQNTVADQTQVQSEVSADTAEGEAATEVTVIENSTVARAGDLSKYADAVQIVLSDDGVTVNGEAAATEAADTNAVYVSNDIIYYEDKDTYESGNPYGEGTDADKHSAEEAAAHTVVNITQPGTYQVTGTLSAGQIFVNVGEEEKDKVTLILNGVDITCEVAPAVLFYEVYECDGEASEETATKDVDTTNAGAKVIIADGSVNNVTGSYVARIYKDQEEEKKLHKYDGAFYSKMSMEITSGEAGDGVLNINAENEGLDTELHLTINGGNINIKSSNDGINVNEDGVSVCTINGGNLNIQSADGEEGDGIDSNGWLVINGGNVYATSNPNSQDAGIDSDMGIYINGGTVIAFGNMYDNVEADSTANTMVLQFTDSSKGDLVVKDANDTEVVSFACTADYTNVVISSDALVEGTYHIYNGETQLSYTGMMMGMGGGRPQMADGEKPQMPENGEVPAMADGERPQMPEGEMPENGERPQMADGEKPQMPEGGMSENGERPQMADGEKPQMPEGEMPENGEMPQRPDGEGQNPADMSGEKSADFTVEKGVNFFGGVTE